MAPLARSWHLCQRAGGGSFARRSPWRRGQATLPARQCGDSLAGPFCRSGPIRRAAGRLNRSNQSRRGRQPGATAESGSGGVATGEPFHFAEYIRTIRLTQTPVQASGRVFAFSVDSKGLRRPHPAGPILYSETEKPGPGRERICSRPEPESNPSNSRTL